MNATNLFSIGQEPVGPVVSVPLLIPVPGVSVAEHTERLSRLHGFVRDAHGWFPHIGGHEPIESEIHERGKDLGGQDGMMIFSKVASGCPGRQIAGASAHRGWREFIVGLYALAAARLRP
jgi:hypothetical protein